MSQDAARTAEGHAHSTPALPVRWPDSIDALLAGDLTAALAYSTPAGGAVVVGIAPLGIRDRQRGTVTFTTSLGLAHKLDRIVRDPRVALAYHARDHGTAHDRAFLLVQGDARVFLEPDERWLREVAVPAGTPVLGAMRRGRFWDWWLHEYYWERVRVEVFVRRITRWPTVPRSRAAAVLGLPLSAAPPDQQPPRTGTAPRVDVRRSADRCRAMPHRILAFRGRDGYPVELPVEVGASRPDGFELVPQAAVIPGGARRAGLLAHMYGPQLVPIAARQLTGWLVAERAERPAIFAPQTDIGFRAPANKTIVLLANGWIAKRGYRRARRSGGLDRLRALAEESASPAPERLWTPDR